MPRNKVKNRYILAKEGLNKYIICYADTETDEWGNKNEKRVYSLNLKLIVLKFQDTFYKFKNANDFIAFLLKKSSELNVRIICYFHNLKFDSKFILKELVNRKQVDIIQKGSNIYAVRLRSHHKIVLEFRDSYCLLMSSIQQLGAKFNLNKLDIHKDDLEEYCKRDVQILEIALQNLFELPEKVFNVKLNRLPYTIAAFSKKLWETSTCKKFDLNLNDFRKKVYLKKDFKFDYYFGGRTELFKINVEKGYFEDLYYNDINSCYPYVMMTYTFPVSDIRYYNVSKIINLPENWIGIECIVEEHMKVPYCPIRENGKVIYPNGRKRVFLFREEYEWLKSNFSEKEFKIVQIIRVYYGTQLPLFKDYIEVLYKLRKESKNESDKHFLKILMNSLYGKFAEKPEKEDFKIFKSYTDFVEYAKNVYEMSKKKYKEISFEDFYLKLSENCEDKGNLIVYRKKNKRFVNSNVFIAAKITALGKLTLYQYMQKDNFDIVYCDTDSIISKHLIEDSKEIGRMKCEHKLLKYSAFGPKEYVYINESNKFECKLKGVNTKQVEISSFEQYVNLLFNGVFQSRPASLRECIKRNFEFESAIELYKQKQTIYDKRKILPDGTTEPIYVKYDEKTNSYEIEKFDNKPIYEKMINNFIETEELKIFHKQPKQYHRKIRMWSPGAEIYCPICKQSLYIDNIRENVRNEINKNYKMYMDYSDEELERIEIENTIKIINENFCPHLVQLDFVNYQAIFNNVKIIKTEKEVRKE